MVVAVVAVAATETSGASLLPFPPATKPSNGSFHLLKSLQCKSASADAKAGCTVDPDVCLSTVTRPSDGCLAKESRASGAGKADDQTSDDWGAVLRRLDALRNTDPIGGFVRDVTYTPLQKNGSSHGSAGLSGGNQLLQEADVVRLLTLQRNSVSGAAHRYLGMYDVLALSRVTVGYCRMEDCTDFSAVPVIGTFASDYYNATHVPLLAHTDNRGRKVPVSMLDEDVLSLGRAVVADPTWLGRAADSWALRVGLTLDAGSHVEQASHRPWNADALGELFNSTHSWDLSAKSAAASTTATAKWLQAVAYVWCAAPMSSFVRTDRDQLCGSMRDHLKDISNGAPRTTIRHTARWAFDPDQRSDSLSGGGGGQPDQTLTRGPSDAPLPTCVFSVKQSASGGPPLVRPAWLVGRTAREINRASAAEVALARRLAPCAHAAARAAGQKPHRRIKYSHVSAYAGVRATASAASQAYDRSMFGVEQPLEPATNSTLTLAIIVLLPELIALVVLLMTTTTWRKVDVVALGLVFLAGLISVAGIIFVAWHEVLGHHWRAASMRDELMVGVNILSDATVHRSLSGEPVYKVETLYVTARLGYRVALLVSLASVAVSAYVVLSLGIGVAVFRRWRRTKAAVKAAAGSDEEGADAPLPPTPGRWRRLGTGASAGGGERRRSPTVALDVDALARTLTTGFGGQSPQKNGA